MNQKLTELALCAGAWLTASRAVDPVPSVSLEVIQNKADSFIAHHSTALRAEMRKEEEDAHLNWWEEFPVMC